MKEKIIVYFTILGMLGITVLLGWMIFDSIFGNPPPEDVSTATSTASFVEVEVYRNCEIDENFWTRSYDIDDRFVESTKGVKETKIINDKFILQCNKRLEDVARFYFAWCSPKLNQLNWEDYKKCELAKLRLQGQ